MRKRKACLIFLFCAIYLISCADSRKRSYLHSLVTEEQTLLCGDYTQNGKSPTEEDICYDLRGVDIDFSLDDYVFEKAEENEEGLLYCVNALSPDGPLILRYIRLGIFMALPAPGIFWHRQSKKLRMDFVGRL